MFTEEFETLDLPFYGIRIPNIDPSKDEFESVGLSKGADSATFLRALVEKGFADKVKDNHEVYRERVDKELSVLEELHFVDYILMVWDVVNYCRKNKIPVGEARGCFVAGSKVKMEDGSVKNIEDIVIGDKVIDAYNTPQSVENTLTYNINENIVVLEMEDGTTIECTYDHKFLTTNRGWVAAGELTEEDDIKEI